VVAGGNRVPDLLAGGWFPSGDLGVLHPDGYIQLKDRSKDIIISGGENISSIEVEDMLNKHPAVMEAAVIGRPDATWCETPCAFVMPKDGPEARSTESEAKLQAQCESVGLPEVASNNEEVAATYAELETDLGHDSFLLESEDLYAIVRGFLERDQPYVFDYAI